MNRNEENLTDEERTQRFSIRETTLGQEIRDCICFVVLSVLVFIVCIVLD